MPDVALERGEMFLRHLSGAMGFERSPALGATHLDRVASYPIRHRLLVALIAKNHLAGTAQPLEEFALMFRTLMRFRSAALRCTASMLFAVGAAAPFILHSAFFSEGNFFSTARLTFDCSPSVPWTATIASAIRAWLRSGIG